MQVFDLTGRLVMQQNLFIQSGFNNLSVDVSSLNSGYYFVEVTGNAVRQRAKFIIARWRFQLPATVSLFHQCRFCSLTGAGAALFMQPNAK